MNRLLFEPEEKQGSQVILRDHRLVHLQKVLKVSVGSVLKTGEIDGPLSTGKVVELSAEQVTLTIEEGPLPSRPSRDLILAVPRPKVLNRLLPQIAALGVDRLVLCNASKVEKNYFDTHVLEEAHLRKQLVEGLVQCGDTRLPEVRVRTQLRHFLEDELSDLIRDADAWLLDPSGDQSLASSALTRTRSVLAIGPEGGWLPSEQEAFLQAGFQLRGLGSRVLRSDTAVIAALSQVSALQEDL